MMQLSVKMASSNTNTHTNNSNINLSNLDLNMFDEDDNLVSPTNSSYLLLEDVPKFIGNTSNCHNFLHINSRSLQRNFDSLSSLISHVDKPLTALAVSETWLKPHNEDTFRLPGYAFACCSRPSRTGGGVGIFINDCIQFKVLHDLTYIADIIECIFVELIIETGSNLIVGCIYRPPSSDINTFNDELTKMLERDYFKKAKDIVIMGDFNINLLQYKVHIPTSEFLINMLSFGLLPCITKPSRVTMNTESLIDNIFTNYNPSLCKSALLYHDISDHYPIIMQFSKPNFKNNKMNQSQKTFRRVISQISIEKFKNYLQSVNWEFTDNNDKISDINLIYDEFLNVFNHGFNICFPKKSAANYKRTPRKEWMTYGLATSCEMKSRLYKQMKNMKTHESKVKFTTYRNKLKSVLDKAEKDFYSKKLSECHGDPKRTWKIINNLVNNKSQNNTPHSIEFVDNNSTLTNNTDIVEKFNEYFVNIGKNLSEKIPNSRNSFSHYMTNTVSNIGSCALHLTTPDEITSIVHNLKSSESAGFDEVSTKLLKSVIDYIADPLCKIINMCIENAIFPDKMKIAKVCPIYKSGAKNEFTNYRPISILPSFSKIFERIISNRILSYVEKYGILAKSQFGFRKKHSTYMAMMQLYDKVSDAIDKNEFCVGIFIDLSKAFDTINHDILLQKLNAYGIRGMPNLLIKNYLQNRKQFVEYGNCQSNMDAITCGVPQGSILGPLLFLLYINDMSETSKLLYFILFADDTNILYSNRDIWQLMKIVNCELLILSDWFKANKLSLNIKKTNFMLFGYKDIPLIDQNNETAFEIIIENEKITKVDSTKFLGVIVDQKLTWHQHIAYISLKISKSLNILSRLKHKLPQKCLISLYYSLIYPHLNYCIIIWGSAYKTTLHRLEILQKRAVRIIDNSHYLSHSEPLFKKYNFLKLYDIYFFSICMFMYKFKYQMLPNVCQCLLMLNIEYNSSTYCLRNVGVFAIPLHRTTVRAKCIKVCGPKYWDSVSDDIKSVPTEHNFKSKLRLSIIDKYN